MTAAPILRTIASWPVPVWSRGVALESGAVYCFADMKGAVGHLDCATGAVRQVARLPAAVSSDLARIAVADGERAAVADHAGNVRLVASDGTVSEGPCVGDKVRAGLRAVETPDGRGLLALFSAAPAFRLLDPDCRAGELVRVGLRHFPAHLGEGIVAAPLVFRVADRDKVFLATRFALVYQVDLASGRLDWSLPLPYGVDSDPVYDDVSGYIVFTTGETLDGIITGFLYAYDPETSQIAWRAPLGGGADVPPLIVDWRGTRIVVTATLRDAAAYAFRIEDGAPVARAAIPETDRCSHDGGACIPVGYGSYHTQTAVCKVYAAPFSILRRDGVCDAIGVTSHNGNLYLFRPGEPLHPIALPGPVRASPAFLTDDRVLLHAGDALVTLTVEGGRLSGTTGSGADIHRLGRMPENRATEIAARRVWQIARYGMKQIGKFTKRKVYY